MQYDLSAAQDDGESFPSFGRRLNSRGTDKANMASQTKKTQKATQNVHRAPKARPTPKVRKWREALNALRSEASYDDLAKLAREPKPPKPLKLRVEISELVVAEKVFQWRGEHSDLHAEERHMRELMRVLQLGRDLEPIDIIQLADQLYLIEGITDWRLMQYWERGLSRSNLSKARLKLRG